MAEIFISHVEEDAQEALEIALGLEEAGYSTWTYEVDSVPGSSYLLKTRQEIDKSKVMIFTISKDSLSSSQIESEVIHAHEEHKGFIPILKDIGFAEFKNRRPDYAQVIGARTAISIPKSGTGLLIPRIIEGLKSLGINPRSKSTVERLGFIRDHLDEIRKSGGKSPPSTPEPYPPPEISDARGKPEIKKKTWPTWLKLTLVGAVVVIVAVGGVLAGKLFSQSPLVNTPLSSTTPTVTVTNTAPASTASTFTPRLTTTPGIVTGPASQPAVPLYGGQLNIYKHPPVNLGYPPEMTSPADLAEAAPAIETLLRYDDSGQPAPHLASSWTVSSDFKSITFSLNKGIKFHDGTELNAESVQYNLDLFRNTKRSELQSVSSIDVIDNYTFRLNLTRFDAYLLPSLCEFAGAMISPTAVQKNGKEGSRMNPVGTGPFKFVSYNSNDPLNSTVRYVKFVGYWQKDKPYLDAVEFEHYDFGDISIAVSKFDQKSYNVFLVDDPTAVTNLKQSFKYEGPSNVAGVLVLIPDSANQDSPLSDIRVRQAVSYSLDTPIICKTANGLAKATNQPEIPDTVFYNPDITGGTYFPNQAKDLLSKAGYPTGFTTKLIYNNHLPLPAKDVASVVKQYLAKIGVDATVTPQDDANFRQIQSLGWHNGLVMDFIDASAEKGPGRVFQGLFSGASSVYPNVIQPKDYQALLAEIASTPIRDDAIRLNKQLLKLMVDNYSLLTPICTGCPTVVKSPSIRDLKMGETWVNQWTPENTWLARGY